MIYLDNAATTKIDHKVTMDIIDALEKYGNPSSIYMHGYEAKQIVEEARINIANKINATSGEIIFTSGGSEANNMAIKGANDYYDLDLIITTEIEHPSVSNTCCYCADHGTRLLYVPVNREGIIDLQVLENLIRIHGHVKFMVSVMMVNNEIGTIQPIKQIAELVHQYDGILHVDAVQAFPHIKIDIEDLDIDLMSVSGHKFGCPKGIGFLYKRTGIEITPLIHGGHQENGLRAGTENVPYIYAMGNQVKRWVPDTNFKTSDFIWETLLEQCEDICEIRLNGAENSKNYIDGILNVTFKGVNAEALITMLDSKGICVSAGSACSSGEKTPSRTLKAIGLSNEDAFSTIRISWSRDTSFMDIEKFIKALRECLILLV